MSVTILGPNPNPARTRDVVIAVPDWSDAATWGANIAPEGGTSLANLTTRQPSQVAGFDVDPTTLVLTGTAPARAALDVVAVILANATTAATWSVGVGDSSNEAIGTHAVDASASAVAGTLEGGAVYDPDGKYGCGVAVSHVTADVTGAAVRTAGPVTGFTPAAFTDFTVMVWVQPATVASIVLFDGLCVLETDASGYLAVRGGALTADVPLIRGTWQHVAVSQRGSDGVRTMWIDGVPVATGGNEVVTDYEGEPLTWGTTQSTGLGMTGRLDECRVFSRVLSTAEVQLEMQSDTVTAANCRVHYRLNGYQSGTRTFGASPNLASYARRNAFLFLPARLTAKVVRITITDTTNPTLLRLGRLFCGTAWQPSRNFDWGYQFTVRDESKDTHTPSGITITDPRAVVPGVEFQLEHVPRLEMLANGYELRRTLGQSGECLVCLDPEETDHMEAMLVYGKLTDLGAIQPVYYDGWRMRWQVEALL